MNSSEIHGSVDTVGVDGSYWTSSAGAYSADMVDMSVSVVVGT